MQHKNGEFDEQKWRYNRKFSDSFKRKKVREIERGHSTVSQIAKAYEVSSTAVYKWVEKFSTNLVRENKVVVEAKSDTQKIQKLEQRIKELEQTVGKKQMSIDFLEKLIELASDEMNTDIKKKYGSEQSSGSGKTGKNTPGR